MEAVGLRLLEGSDLAPAFEQAGVLPQHVHARISHANFAKVNTVKGQWSLIEDLTAVPQSVAAPLAYFARPPPAQDILATVGAMAQGAAAAAAQAEAVPEEVQRIVRSIAVEVLGEGQELDSTGQFPAGTLGECSSKLCLWDVLSSIIPSQQMIQSTLTTYLQADLIACLLWSCPTRLVRR